MDMGLPVCKWASEAGDMFWICGKPASGKSTVMEYFTRNKELQARLRQGINDKWTVVHHFFFDFDVNNDRRNDVEGFIRSLLYQLTEELEAADLRGVEPEHGWSLRTLKERLTTIIKQRSNPICILLDGLDEYQGDQWELASFLQETASSRVKLCVASRPHHVFTSTFEQIPTIKMQDLNFRAIDEMVTLTIQRDMASSGYKRKEVVELANGISAKAQGVFLWARFAIEELRDGWSERLDLKGLKKRLEIVPEELGGIYARIFKKLRPDQRQLAAYMLQLVCYSKRTLTLRELYAATAHAADGKSPLDSQISTHDIQDFEQRILAVTGGVLKVFWAHGPDESEDDDYAEMPKGETFVNVIHRTVRTYLENENSKDSSGWFQILGTAHEGSLHAQVLWLRVCAAIFPPSFHELPPVNPPSLPSSSSSDDQLSPNTPPGKDKGSDTTGSFSPLLKYAALYMLHHAADVEQALGLSSYSTLQPGMSNSFLRFHLFYWEQPGSYCKCFRWDCPKPSHPLHLAITHGLEGYVKDFLSTKCQNNRPGSREWDKVFYIEKHRNRREKFLGSFSMSLLEFALYYSNNIAALLLQRYSHAHDAEISVALQYSSSEVVKLLLRGRPDGKMMLKSSPWISDLLERDLSLRGLSELCPHVSDFDPMWYIARRHATLFRDDDAELIDLFIGRGEDINAQCSPVGTPLHSALIRPAISKYVPYMAKLLVAKGANVNATGPFGTPLELVWRLANTTRNESYPLGFKDPIRWLIKSGAVNNRCDPNGSIPSKERMLSFGADGIKGVRESQALYRGKSVRR